MVFALFSEMIRENIMAAVSGRQMRRSFERLEKPKIALLSGQFEKGYDTQIAEGGDNLGTAPAVSPERLTKLPALILDKDPVLDTRQSTHPERLNTDT